MRLACARRHFAASVVSMLVVLAACMGTPAYSASASGNTIIVTTPAELGAALSPDNAGRRILVRAGIYEISHPLEVPERASLSGESVMLFDSAGLPSGLDSTGRTLIRATATLTGDFLTLRNGASLQGLAIEDGARSGLNSGSAVTVVSATAGDWVAASIDECEVIAPNPPGIASQGPSGRGVVVLSRNLNLGADPAPHDGSVLSLQMRRSIIRAPRGGGGVFAGNFASSSRISVFLQQNVIGGGLDTAAGASRPDVTTDSSVAIESKRNLYRSEIATPVNAGVRVVGGLDAPFPNLVGSAATANRMRLASTDDRIEGFPIGVFAAGALRVNPLAQPSSLNSVDLTAIRLTVRSTVSDLRLFGTQSSVNGVPGNGNLVRLVLREADASGPRDNWYFDSANPSMANLGEGNRLEVVGSLNAFVQTNPNVAPPPAPQFFSGP